MASPKPGLKPNRKLVERCQEQGVWGSKKPKNIQELEKIVRAAWKSIPLERIQVLVDNMPQRIQACIAAKGGPTKY